ncbi:hypothetical protein ACSW9V_15570 (plasmid) [Clostridium perfringens]|uniref:hypothetical protein n=1 Tax=Clostridium perfringens TaxID=1502 RepID=UPI000B374C53|nr:hypothetical protein [Clostridium perfringens]EGT0694038.1 hypothetical protein [Clostridium perfringens]EGT0697129.1 hypothetical protein [Clostridium perfringens]MDU3376306.1 hypothetical protein [Clostridium perfringens]MDU3535947.1 hypothetical protein [Clostridium perfringens]OUN51898.1 hypothetical protein B5G18_11645 [Clostridium perfringens]
MERKKAEPLSFLKVIGATIVTGILILINNCIIHYAKNVGLVGFATLSNYLFKFTFGILILMILITLAYKLKDYLR